MTHAFGGCGDSDAQRPRADFAIERNPVRSKLARIPRLEIMTDADARRPYLRQTDPRPEAERGSDPVVEVSTPLSAETPAGARVTLLPPESSGASGTAA